MRVEVTHSLGVERATSRLDRFLDDLTARQWPGGLAIGNSTKTWAGNRLAFSFDAGAAGIGVTIDGAIEVTEDRVTVDSDLPMLVRTFVGEARVAEIVRDGLSEALA